MDKRIEATTFSSWASELRTSGDHYAAAIICFVGKFYVLGDDEAMLALAQHAASLSERRQPHLFEQVKGANRA